MKKHITLLLLLIIHLSAWCQKSITTDALCTEAMAQNANGRWMKHPSFDRGSSTSAEANKRIDEIHNMVVKIYPQPTGVDAVWHRAVGMSYFAAKRKYIDRESGRKFEDTDLPHFTRYYYSCLFFAYYCDPYRKNILSPGYPGETGTHVTITANEIQGSVGGASDMPWTINGLPIKMRSPVLKTIRGYELQYPEPGSNARYVLIHRKGILPYIPVTRKQYLDQCSIHTTKVYEEMIKAQEQIPVRTPEDQEKEKKARLAKFEKDFGSDPKRLKSAVDYYLSGYQTDQQQRDEKVEKTKNLKMEELKRFTDELDKTTKENLLDSPAHVVVMFHSSPVFEPNLLKGHMLVTENPDYVRKDLPKHVPQVFVVWWRCNNWGPQKRIGEIMEQDFPFEKLQAMIDK